MIKGIDLSKNCGLACSDYIENICQPLFEMFHLNYFNYVKIKKNGARCILTNRPDFISTYYNNSELFSTKAVLFMENQKDLSYYLSSEFSDQASYIVARTEFNIDNGITIIQPSTQFTELFYFGTTRENSSNIKLYLNNIDLLYRFIFYFKDKAFDLIKKAENEMFYLPDILIPNTIQIDYNVNTKRSKFIKNTQLSRFPVIKDGIEIFITRREAQCLHYLTIAKSAKEIGNLLGISSRTVETYFQNIREKSGFRNKSEILQFLRQSDCGKFINYCFGDETFIPNGYIKKR